MSRTNNSLSFTFQQKQEKQLFIKKLSGIHLRMES